MSQTSVDAALDLAARLPRADILRLATAAAAKGSDGLGTLRSQVASPLLREACDQLRLCTDATGEHLAGLLIGASSAMRRMAAEQRVEIVWTGPDSSVQTSRSTALTITELIDSGTEELLLVSYATYRESRLTEAVVRAVERDVDATLLLERHIDNPSYTSTADPFEHLAVRRWTWPRDHRPDDAALHAKIVVVDRRTALLGSADLTGRAFTSNLECGVLIRGGAQPAAVRDHLWSLRQRGVLLEVAD